MAKWICRAYGEDTCKANRPCTCEVDSDVVPSFCPLDADSADWVEVKDAAAMAAGNTIERKSE